MFFAIPCPKKIDFRRFILAKNRSIAIPLDLESQVSAMFNRATILTRQTSKWLQASKIPKMERSQSQVKFILQ